MADANGRIEQEGRRGYARAGLVIYLPVRKLCTRRYPGHPRGCPNYGRRPTCPPDAPMIDLVLDMEQPTFVIWNRFDLAGHVQKLRERHPDWTERQLYCCLYWQGQARRELRLGIRAFCREHPGMRVVGCPEGAAVNVTETMRLIGIDLEWPPRRVAYQVVVAGYPATGEKSL